MTAALPAAARPRVYVSFREVQGWSALPPRLSLLLTQLPLFLHPTFQLALCRQSLACERVLFPKKMPVPVAAKGELQIISPSAVARVSRTPVLPLCHLEAQACESRGRPWRWRTTRNPSTQLVLLPQRPEVLCFRRVLTFLMSH